MKKRKGFLIKVMASAGGVLALTVVFLLKDGFQGLPSEPFPQPEPRFSSWREVFAHPADITLQSLVTGVVEGDRFVVLDHTDPKLKHMQNRYEPSVVMSHWLTHPARGDILIDAGLSETFSKGSGNYNALMKLVLHLIKAHTTQESGTAAVTQLARRGVKPQMIFLTHLHADHSSGAVDFANTTAVVFGAHESGFIQKAMMGRHLSGKRLLTIDFSKATRMPPFEKVVDVFGDGSLWAISTPGHSPDHISYLVNAKSGATLITGDAAAYFAQLEYVIKPNPKVHDVDQALEHLSKLHEFLTDFPDIEVRVGHEYTNARAPTETGLRVTN